MNQISATFFKNIKYFLREKPVLFWTIGWPIFWVLMGCFVFVTGYPEDLLPYVKGSTTLSMMVFAIMIAGIANMPGNISTDREWGLFLKLISMPIKPWKDSIGRIFSLFTFSILSVVLVLLVGYICGSRFLFSVIKISQSVGYFILAILASSGIGMIIGIFIKHVHGAIMTGVGITVVISGITGMFFPYSALPKFLQIFSRFFPVSSANSSIIYLLTNESLAGYNPISMGQIIYTMAISIIIFIVGLILYSRFCWKTD